MYLSREWQPMRITKSFRWGFKFQHWAKCLLLLHEIKRVALSHAVSHEGYYCSECLGVTYSCRHFTLLWPAFRQFLIPGMVHTATRAQSRQMASALVPVNEGTHGWVQGNPRSLVSGVWLHAASHTSGTLGQWRTLECLLRKEFRKLRNESEGKKGQRDNWRTWW